LAKRYHAKVLASAWSNGSPSRTGAGYGLKFTDEDRDRHFDRHWKTVVLELDGGQTVTASVSEAFWRKCAELRAAGIGRWLMANEAAPWPKEARRGWSSRTSGATGSEPA
jgi:hypothetical protein